MFIPRVNNYSKTHLLISESTDHGNHCVRCPCCYKQEANRNGSFSDPHFCRLSVCILVTPQRFDVHLFCLNCAWYKTKPNLIFKGICIWIISPKIFSFRNNNIGRCCTKRTPCYSFETFILCFCFVLFFLFNLIKQTGYRLNVSIQIIYLFAKCFFMVEHMTDYLRIKVNNKWHWYHVTNHKQDSHESFGFIRWC